jgi:hypothetical protein
MFHARAVRCYNSRPTARPYMNLEPNETESPWEEDGVLHSYVSLVHLGTS